MCWYTCERLLEKSENNRIGNLSLLFVPEYPRNVKTLYSSWGVTYLTDLWRTPAFILETNDTRLPQAGCQAHVRSLKSVTWGHCLLLAVGVWISGTGVPRIKAYYACLLRHRSLKELCSNWTSHRLCLWTKQQLIWIRLTVLWLIISFSIHFETERHQPFQD
jgi:hypothetical protein